MSASSHLASIVLIPLFVSAGVSFAVISWSSDRSQGPAADALAVDDLRERQAELTRRLERLEQRLQAASVARREREPLTDERIEQVVERWWRARQAAGGGAEAGPVDAAARGAELDLDTALHQLVSGALGHEQEQELWGRITRAGLIDRVIAALEARAAANPGVADEQVRLGKAYLQKLMTIDNDMEKGVWAMKADRAYDRALEIDSRHWEARFLKATSLSFWPPIMGKGPEAIRHFEVLIEQQEHSGARRPEYAQTYLFLGNLYQQQGKVEKARELWQRGYDLFPNDEDLRKKVQRD